MSNIDQLERLVAQQQDQIDKLRSQVSDLQQALAADSASDGDGVSRRQAVTTLAGTGLLAAGGGAYAASRRASAINGNGFTTTSEIRDASGTTKITLPDGGPVTLPNTQLLLDGTGIDVETNQTSLFGLITNTQNKPLQLQSGGNTVELGFKTNDNGVGLLRMQDGTLFFEDPSGSTTQIS